MKDKAHSLLKQVEKIIEKHDAIDKATGGKFNIFTILERDRSETRHSRFLAELLDPKGSHGQGNVYLKLFYETLEDEFKEQWLQQNISFNLETFTDKALVYTEQSNGENGLIDIIIETTTHAIIIENKVYAGDQDKQLERYAQSKKNKNILIIYLTLDGHQPSQNSLGLLKIENVVLLSYAIHIIKWLKACINASATLPTIRETLVQYVKLLQKMTYQAGETMEKEMIELLLKDGNLKIAQEINNVLPKARANLEVKFWDKVNELLIPILNEYGFRNWEYDPNDVIERILTRTKSYCEIIDFYVEPEYLTNQYFNFSIGCDATSTLYICCYLCQKDGTFIKDSQSNCMQVLKNPFGTNKPFKYFGKERNFYYDGVYELINHQECNELAQETVNDLVPILKVLKTHIDNYFNNNKK